MIPEDKIHLENGVFYIDQHEQEEDLKLGEGDRVRFGYQGEMYVGKVVKMNYNHPDIVPIKEYRKLP